MTVCCTRASELLDEETRRRWFASALTTEDVEGRTAPLLVTGRDPPEGGSTLRGKGSVRGVGDAATETGGEFIAAMAAIGNPGTLGCALVVDCAPMLGWITVPDLVRRWGLAVVGRDVLGGRAGVAWPGEEAGGLTTTSLGKETTGGGSACSCCCAV